MADLTIIGGGLAGSEAAWQAAQRGYQVDLYEMRPGTPTGAHTSDSLAELVCSNSLGSNMIDRASGLLKEECRRMGSLLVHIAELTALPAGGALAVDRERFSAQVTAALESHPRVHILREESRQVPEGLAILASGPLTSAALSLALQQLSGQKNLFFFDAIAPIVRAESIDMTRAFRASRYQAESLDGDYINCPLTREEYQAFHTALIQAERIRLHDFEQSIEQGVDAGAGQFFEGCLPVEVLAARGERSLAFGPLRPVGLRDPHTQRRPYAVVQLRQDNLAGSLYNLVGFQTNLTFTEQRRVFRMIPGLEQAEFERYGQMHRNTFIASPQLLEPTLQFRERPQLFFAGQLTGVEGYMGNIATGLLAGINAARTLAGLALLHLPPESMLGALCQYVTHAHLRDFQPMKANFGILPPLEAPARSKRERAMQYVERSLTSLEVYLSTAQFTIFSP